MTTAAWIISIILGVFAILGVGGFFGIRDRYKKALKEYGEKIKQETTIINSLSKLHERVDNLEKEKGGCAMGKQANEKIDNITKRVEKLEEESRENGERFVKIETGLKNIEKNVNMLVDNLIKKQGA